MVTNKTILFYFLVILSVTYTKSQFMDSSFGFLGGDLSNALNYLVNKQYKNLNTSLRNYNQTIIPLLNVTIREYNRKSIGNNPKNRLKNIDLNKNRNKVVNHLKHNNINNINSINKINNMTNNNTKKNRKRKHLQKRNQNKTIIYKIYKFRYKHLVGYLFRQ